MLKPNCYLVSNTNFRTNIFVHKVKCRENFRVFVRELGTYGSDYTKHCRCLKIWWSDVGIAVSNPNILDTFTQKLSTIIID